MGQSNAAVRQWMGNPKRFADLFNATVFNGEQVISLVFAKAGILRLNWQIFIRMHWS